MKIAFVGKGGSGKSSMSWLFSVVLRNSGKRVLSIDADHNMDLSYMLGLTVDEQSPTLHRSHDLFRHEVGQVEDAQWRNIVLDGRQLSSFRLSPKDSFTDRVTTQVGENHDVMVVGLGAEDIIFSNRCAHGHSAPLKYYLPLLELSEDEVCIIDGVAGVDMMNFGLLVGVDVIVVVVEPHMHSIRVFKEISRIASLSDIPVMALINKSKSDQELGDFISEYDTMILGRMTSHEAILGSDSGKIDVELRRTVLEMMDTVSQKKNSDTPLERMRRFETMKERVRS
jgi:CO dehydrogenase maturation factor